MALNDVAYQKCIFPSRGKTFAVDEALVACTACGDLLDVLYDWDRAEPLSSLAWLEGKWTRRFEPICFSGVWRFHELLPFAQPDAVVTVGEGQTLLQRADSVACYVGIACD